MIEYVSGLCYQCSSSALDTLYSMGVVTALGEESCQAAFCPMHACLLGKSLIEDV
jgi:hypothetical protein